MGAWADLRYSARSLTRTPGLAVTLWLTIAVGIGANASVAGFVRGLVTRDLPLPGIESVVSLFARDEQDAFGPVSFDDYLALRARRDAFASLGVVRESPSPVVLGDNSSVMSVAAVTPEAAALLALSLGAEGDGGERVDGGVVISARVWREELGSKDAVRGDEIQIGDTVTRIAGVAPDWLEGLYLGRAVDVWMALPDDPGQGIDRRSRSFWALGRLRPGVSALRAQAALNAVRQGQQGGQGKDLIAVLPYTGMTPEVAGGMSRLGRLLPAAGGAVFFAACVNVAAFLLSRAFARSRETSVRVALGASRGQLARQLLSDSVFIALTGGGLGLLLAVWTAHLVPALFFEQDAAALVFAPDAFGIGMATTACVGVTVVCGLIPLFAMRHDEPAAVLQRENVGPSTAIRRVRASLVVAQMACCCVLVIATGLVLHNFHTALQTRTGHRLERSILATVDAPRGFARDDLGLQHYRDAERAARTIPGISSAAWVGTLPGSRPIWQPVRVEPPHLPIRHVLMDVAAFTPGPGVVAFGRPLAGRMFGRRDISQACPVVLVNEEAARNVFAGHAVGRAIEDAKGQQVEIIGVVATPHAHTSEVESSGGSHQPTIYYYVSEGRTPPVSIGPAEFQVPVLPEAAGAVLENNVVSSGYFEAMGLSLAAGAIFPDAPASYRCRVGVINQEAADRYFAGDAVGGAVIDTAGRRTHIVGVVRTSALRTSQRRPEPAIFLPMTQDFLPRMTLMLAARDTSPATLESLRRRLETASGGNAGTVVVTTLDAHLSRTALASERIAAILMGTFTVSALTLGVLGLYGTMADAAHRRRREIAVRIALGAHGWRVIRPVLVEGLRLAAAGTLAGMVGSLLVTRWLAGVTPTDAGSLPVWVWLAAPLVLIVAVAIASVLPVRRALMVDPLTIMRDS